MNENTMPYESNWNLALGERAETTDNDVDTDGYFFSFKLGDRVNTLSLGYDVDIKDMILAVRDFLVGSGWPSESIDEFIDTDW